MSQLPNYKNYKTSDIIPKNTKFINNITSSLTKKRTNKATLDEDDIFQPKRAKRSTKDVTLSCSEKQTTLRLVNPSKAHKSHLTTIAVITHTQRTEFRQPR